MTLDKGILDSLAKFFLKMLKTVATKIDKTLNKLDMVL